MGAVAAILLAASLWSFNIATYNWFAADFHNEFSNDYASRGNVFCLASLALLGGSVLVVVGIFRSRKKQKVGTLDS
jgi:hypothetical protein